jgi:hypothetical protein
MTVPVCSRRYLADSPPQPPGKVFVFDELQGTQFCSGSAQVPPVPLVAPLSNLAHSVSVELVTTVVCDEPTMATN